MLAWPFAIDWASPFQESRAYQTGIFVAEDGTEQRVQLRSRARRRYRFDVAADLAEAARLDAALETARTEDVALPFWPHATTLDADATAAATALSLDTTGLEFLPGSYALLLDDATNYELVAIASVSGSGLTLPGELPLANSWPAGTLVIPCFAGRIDAARRVTREAPHIAVAECQCSVHPWAVPSGPTPGSIMQVFPLEAAIVRDPVEAVASGMARLDPQLSDWSERAVTDESATDTDLDLQLTAAQVQRLWNWYDSRLGALGVTWIPSWHDALTLASPMASSATVFPVVASGYTGLQFPRISRRQLGIVGGDGQVLRRLITASVDNGDGTESLTTDVAPGRALVPGQDMLCQLRTMRLAEDEVTVDWEAPDYATASLGFHERPDEATAQPSDALVTCLLAISAEQLTRTWQLLRDYGGSFTLTSCTGVTLDGAWDVPLGGGNGRLQLERVFSGLEPGAEYALEADVEWTEGDAPSLATFLLDSDGGSVANPGNDFYDFETGGVQHLRVTRTPDASGRITFRFGARGIEVAEPQLTFVITNMTLSRVAM